MFIELLDGLRCVSEHPQIPLVTAITKRDDRFVIEGIVGCPTCRQEYPIRDGIAWFGSSSEVAVTQPNVLSDDVDGAMRIGAFLLVSDGITIALVGEWARYSLELSAMVGLRAFAVNPQSAVGESERVGVVCSDNRLPFTDGSLRGLAIDESGWTERDIELAVRALSSGGRMVAPASLAVPGGVEEIARDEDVWVGEKRGPLVTLHRR